MIFFRTLFIIWW